MAYADVRLQLASLLKQAGRSVDSLRLIAVSKTKSVEQIRSVYAEGQREFGENYVDELLSKAEALKSLPDLHWVFIGQLQSNKIQRLVAAAHEIQTIASEKHARYVERYAQEYQKSAFPVWIHVNAEGEDQKFGVPPSAVATLAKFITSSCPHLELQGIMAIPPNTYNDKNATGSTPELYKTLVGLARRTGRGKLSLGMSSDLRLAINAGSDCVRIGTAIFGQRI